MTSAVSLVEFLQPVRAGSHRERVLGTMLWLHDVQGAQWLKSREILDALLGTKIKQARSVNVADVLAKAEHRVAHQDGRWRLTTPGRAYVAELGLAAGIAKPAADDVRAVVAHVTDLVAKSYVEESVICLEAGALRAAVVFLWSGTIRMLQDKAMTHAKAKRTAAVQKHDSRAPTIGKIEDFARVKDATQLLAFRELGMIDKGEWDTLDEGLRLRNRCGHPTHYTPGIAKVRAFIEDVVGIVF